LDLRLAPAEFDECLHRIAAAASFQDAREKAPRDIRVEDACFFERAERIRGEHFRPLVTVVARGIAAGEDVLEAVREAIERRRYDDGDVATDFLEDTHDAVRILRLLAVDAQIEQR